MTLTRLQKMALGLAGVTALGIGSFILAAPHAFYASYGITLGGDPDLLSELRAPGAGLAAFGLVMLAGVPGNRISATSIIAALTVFLAFPAGRIVGLLADGPPSTGIIAALLLELAIAVLCALAFRPRARSRARGRGAARAAAQ